MIGVIGGVFGYRLTLCILHIWLTIWKFPCYLGELLIDKFCLFLVTHLWIKIENCHDLGITILSSEFPRNLYDGTVNLDAQEVLWLSRYADSRLEGDCSIDVRHGGSAHKGIAIPGASVIPRKVESRLAILHDSRNAIIVIG